jgi:hypothetical protein
VEAPTVSSRGAKIAVCAANALAVCLIFVAVLLIRETPPQIALPGGTTDPAPQATATPAPTAPTAAETASPTPPQTPPPTAVPTATPTEVAAPTSPVVPIATPTATPISTPEPTPVTPPAYISVAVDGVLLLAAQPVTPDEWTVDAVLRAAHRLYYHGGEQGYSAQPDATWGLFTITYFWGRAVSPPVCVNDALLSDTAEAPVSPGDNIVVTVPAPGAEQPPVTLSYTAEPDGKIALVAKWWALSLATFEYESAPLVGAPVIDPATGRRLGTTNAWGSVTVTPPKSGCVAVDGAAAIRVTADEQE